MGIVCKIVYAGALVLLASCQAGYAGTTVLASDNLAVTLDTVNGLVQGTTSYGYSFSTGTTKMGFSVRDVVTGAAEESAEGALSYDSNGWLTGQLSAPVSNIRITPSFKSMGNYIAVRAEVKDLSGSDRAVAASFRIPIHATSGTWRWRDDINSSRTVNYSATPGSFTINGYLPGGVLTPTLAAGQLYTITASGQAVVAQTPGEVQGWRADAEYMWYVGSNGITVQLGPYEKWQADPQYETWDLQVDGANVDWEGSTDGVNWATHRYSPSHVYRYKITGTGEPVRLSRLDGLRNEKSGYLTAQISPLPPSTYQRYDAVDVQRYSNPIDRTYTCFESDYPFCAVGNDVCGLSLGIPLTKPSTYKFGYVVDTSGQGYLEISYEIGLSTAFSRDPSAADVEFIIYASDPKWGFRSAAKQYYGIYPQVFEKRTKREGQWYLDMDPLTLEQPWDFGMIFDEQGTLTNTEMKYDNVFEIYALHYMEPGGIWTSFSGYDSTPAAEFPQVVGVSSSELKNKFMTNPTSWHQTLSAAALNDKNGDWGWVHWQVGNAGNRATHMTAMMNPDIPGGYGRLLLDTTVQTMQSYAAQSLDLNGMFQDSCGGYVSNMWENYRRSLWAYTNIPLTYSHETKRPVNLHRDSMADFMASLSQTLRASGMLNYANVGPPVGKFMYPYFDAFGPETGGGSASGYIQKYLRTYAYQKPLSWMDTALVQGADQPTFPRERAFNYCLYWGMFPGSIHFIPTNSANVEAVRPIYKQYTPLITEVAKAGWEPITNAISRTTNVSTERFGDYATDGVVYFTVLSNESFTGTQGEISIDRQALGIASGTTLVSHELTTGNAVTWTLESGGIRMRTYASLAGITKVRAIRVATPAALSGIYAGQVSEYLHRVRSQVQWFLLRDSRNDVRAQFQGVLSQVEAIIQKLDASLAANNNRPPEADLVTTRNALAELLVLIGQLPQSEKTIAISLAQCQSARTVVQKSIDILHFLPTVSVGRISGHVDLLDFTGTKSLTPIKVELIHNGSPVRCETVFLDASGNYALENVYVATYKVRFSGHKWLSKAVTPVTVSAGATSTCNASLVNGDADGDNETTSTDLSILLRNAGVVGG